MVTSSIVVVGQTATLLFTAPGPSATISNVYLSGLGVYLGDLFIGASNVTPQTGFHYIQSGGSIPLNGGDSIYGVSLSSSISVAVTVIPDGGAGGGGTVTQGPGGVSPWTVDIAKLAGITPSVNSGVKDTGTLRIVLATDQPALTNKLLVTPDSVALPANQSVNVAQMGSTTTSMNTGVRDAGTQRVTIATNDVVPVTVAATLSVNAAQFGGTNVTTGTGAAGAGIPRVTVSNDSNVLITPPTLTKGTQAATGLSVQALSDAGRNLTTFFMAASVAATNAEVMQSLTGYKSGAAVGATATPAVVTAGKIFRIVSVSMSYQSLATAGAAQFRLRANTGGVAIVSSPLVVSWTLGSAAAAAGVVTTFVVTDSWEFAAGTGIAVGVLGLNTVGAALAAGFVTIAITGYEY